MRPPHAKYMYRIHASELVQTNGRMRVKRSCTATKLSPRALTEDAMRERQKQTIFASRPSYPLRAQEQQ